MSAIATLGRIETAGLVLILRSASALDAVAAARAAASAGVRAIEVTYSVPGALDAIRAMAEDPDLIVGAGTVVDERQALDAIEAGARFVVSPGVDDGVVRACTALDVLVLPGVLTATEVMRATALGALALKLFPAATVGPAHLRALLGPFPGLRVIPSGGIDEENLESWFAAGAVAVGIGGAMSPSGPVDPPARARIAAVAASAITAIQTTRERITT